MFEQVRRDLLNPKSPGYDDAARWVRGDGVTFVEICTILAVDVERAKAVLLAGNSGRAKTIRDGNGIRCRVVRE